MWTVAPEEKLLCFRIDLSIWHFVIVQSDAADISAKQLPFSGQNALRHVPTISNHCYDI